MAAFGSALCPRPVRGSPEFGECFGEIVRRRSERRFGVGREGVVRTRVASLSVVAHAL